MQGQGQRYALGEKAFYIIGREGEVDIAISDPSVSRIHAAVVHHQDGRIYLIDLQSASAATPKCLLHIICCFLPGLLGKPEVLSAC